MNIYRTFIVFVLFFFWFCIPLFSQPVSQSEVIHMADNFMMNKMIQSGIHCANFEIETIDQWRDNDLLYGYVINYKEGGFVIATADQRFYPVLAFSLSESFYLAKAPPNCQSWLDCYKSQIRYAHQNNAFISAMPAIWQDISEYKFSQKVVSLVEPLTTSVWDQLGCHNHMCPADPDAINGFVPVGCVPLAMAQLMYYYRFPKSGLGSVVYTPTYQSGIYGPQYANFAEATYDWNAMTDKCREENTAVAELCYHAGVSVEVSYMPESSGSNINKVTDALTSHFKYACDDYLLRSDVAGTTEWVSLLMENLNRRQPIIYRSSAGFGGHVYLCDGYQDSTHFHFNWGWGGTYNGYYYIDDLNPGGIQINFSQGAIFNIYPDTSQYAYPLQQDFTLLSNNVGSFEDGSGPENYADGITASYLIQPQDSRITNIMLVFSNLDTELDSDIIKIYNGPDTTAPPVKTYSGHEAPAPYYSSAPEMFVTFKSNDEINGNGFHANYYGYHLPFCGETVVLTDSVGTLDDGSSYHNYQNNADCSWLIAPEINPYDSISQISLLFYHFDVSQGDTLFIYDGEDNTTQLIGKFWQESTPTELISNDNRVFIEFKTDNSQKAQGWGFFWDYKTPGYCSDTLLFHEPEGQISDGSGEKRYVSNSNCYYLIEVPEAESISLEFLEFEFEDDYDYLKIYDANQPNIPLAKLSGSQLPPDLSWPLNKLLLEFYSDDSQNFQGFTLNYAASLSSIEEQKPDIQIYPNPAKNILSIHAGNIELENAKVLISRPDGTLLLSKTMKSPHENISIRGLPPGMYILSFLTNKNETIQKLMKQ